MIFITWILKQMTNKNKVTVFMFFNYDKSYKTKSRSIFFCAHSLHGKYDFVSEFQLISTVVFIFSMQYIAYMRLKNHPHYWREYLLVTILFTDSKYNNLHPISHYDPLGRIKSIMLCVLITYVSSELYSLKSTPKDRFLNNFSWYFIYSQYL